MAALHQQPVDGRRLADVERRAPDGRGALAHRGLQARDQRRGPCAIVAAGALEERLEQRGAHDRQAFRRNLFARHHRHVGVERVEQCTVSLQVLPHDGEERGVQLARGDHDGEVVHVVVGARDDADRGVNTGCTERLGLGADAAHHREPRLLRSIRVDHRDLEPVRMEGPHHLAAEASIAAHDPAAVGRRTQVTERRARQRGEPGDQPVVLGRRDRERELLTEARERVDDVVGTERGHVGGGLAPHGARQHRQVGLEQPHRHRHREVGAVVVGQGEHAAAVVLAQACGLEVHGQARVAGERERRLVEVHEVDFLGARLVDFHDHEASPAAVERAGDQVPGLAEAADQVEGLDQSPHPAPEALLGERVPHRAVAAELQQVGEQVGPADHRCVDDHRHPQPLPVGEGVRDLAEADGARRVAREVERLEQRHAPWPAFGVHAGDQHQPGHADRVDHHQQDDGRAQAPQRQQQRAVHLTSAARWSRRSGSPRRRCSRAPRPPTATRC